MIPSVGRIVHVTLNDTMAQAINKRRRDASVTGFAGIESGGQMHFGNQAEEGQVYPMLITRVWGEPTENSGVNGQIFLDGNDVYWGTSIGPKTEGNPWGWFEPPRV